MRAGNWHDLEHDDEHGRRLHGCWTIPIYLTLESPKDDLWCWSLKLILFSWVFWLWRTATCTKDEPEKNVIPQCGWRNYCRVAGEGLHDLLTTVMVPVGSGQHQGHGLHGGTGVWNGSGSEPGVGTESAAVKHSVHISSIGTSTDHWWGYLLLALPFSVLCILSRLLPVDISI